MATNASRTIELVLSGDVVGTQTHEAADNAAAPGVFELKTLASGANTITAPTGGATVSAVTIIPPAGNTVVLTLKGVSGDTGIPLHLTGPSSIALPSSVVSFVINAASTCTGVQFIWT
jgi:hypothetical protein